MPKLIDYGVRFELIREAVLAIAAREGVQAITLARVAEQMQVSADTVRRTIRSPSVLPGLGLELVARRRRVRRLMRGRGGHPAGTVEGGVEALLVELPLDDERLEEARAWCSLTASHAGAATDRAVELVREHDHLTRALVQELVGALALSGEVRDVEAARLHALVEGLTTRCVTGWLSSDEGRRVLEHHVHDLASRAVEHVA